MSESRGFVTHTIDSSPAAARAALEATRSRAGFLPTATARLAAAPAVLAAFGQWTGAFERTSLSPIEREVVIFAVARRNGCDLCKAFHTAGLLRLEAPPALIEALRRGEPLGDPRLDALDAFARSVLESAGDPGAGAWRGFLAAGFSREQALEIVLGIAAYTLSTFANRLVEAPIDPQLQAFA